MILLVNGEPLGVNGLNNSLKNYVPVNPLTSKPAETGQT